MTSLDRELVYIDIINITCVVNSAIFATIKILHLCKDALTSTCILHTVFLPINMPGCDANHEGDANIIVITLNLNVNKGIKIQENFIMVISIEA